MTTPAIAPPVNDELEEASGVAVNEFVADASVAGALVVAVVVLWTLSVYGTIPFFHSEPTLLAVWNTVTFASWKVYPSIG